MVWKKESARRTREDWRESDLEEERKRGRKEREREREEAADGTKRSV